MTDCWRFLLDGETSLEKVSDRLPFHFIFISVSEE